MWVIFFFQRVKIPYARGSRYLTGQAVPEALVSRKVVYREVCTEGSETAKSGTDTSTSSAQAKQERYMRHICLG